MYDFVDGELVFYPENTDEYNQYINDNDVSCDFDSSYFLDNYEEIPASEAGSYADLSDSYGVLSGEEIQDDSVDPDYDVPDIDNGSVSALTTFNDNFDDFIELYAAQYNIYPNTSAVNVFDFVLDGLSYVPGYVILSGSDSSSAYLYYAEDYDVNGNQIVLYSPVTQCSYYRSYVGSSYNYFYNVSSVGQQTFNVGNQLIYTNLVEGYPDVCPLPENSSLKNLDYVLLPVFVGFLLFCLYNIISD